MRRLPRVHPAWEEFRAWKEYRSWKVLPVWKALRAWKMFRARKVLPVRKVFPTRKNYLERNLQAIQDCGLTGNLKKDRAAIKDALGKIQSFPGITGNMKFTPEGDPVKDAVIVRVTKEGEFEFVKSLQP